jgi:hypothetical protein
VLALRIQRLTWFARGPRAEENMSFAKSSTWAAAALAAALLAPPGARAQLIETSIQPAGDTNWSATAGRTVGNNNSVLHVEAGWPGIGFTFLKSLDERQRRADVAYAHRARVRARLAGSGRAMGFQALFGVAYNTR